MTEPNTTTDAAEVLASLRAKLESVEPPSILPDRLSVTAIDQYPELFQPRNLKLDEHHVQDLARIVKRQGRLDPILLLPVGKRAVLIDGHHRLEAYRAAHYRKPVPVCWFHGTLQEAILEAGRANSKAKLVMPTQERMNFAWRLVLLDEHSKREIMEAAGVSKGQVGNMRKVMTDLGPDAYSCRFWWEARELHKGQSSEPMTDDQREAWMEELANDYADRMHKTFGRKLGDNPEVAARAIALHLGRRTWEVVRYLRDHLSEDEWLDEDDY
ncbi:MAG: hypothetical protein AXW12_10070 [Thalassospira sp. Nap_22]|nr:MAG: hypothetical protein AXW12_10070 [Thalassospira sp. Nap_22]